MGRKTEIAALPSKIIMPDGTVRDLDSLSPEERLERLKRVSDRFNKMLNKEGLYVRELHTNSKIKVLFRKVGNSSVMSERIKIY